MSQLDAAFIKAYGLSEAARRAAQGADSATPVEANPATRSFAASETRTATTSAENADARDDRQLDLRIDGSHGTKRPRTAFRSGTDWLLDDVNSAAATATATAVAVNDDWLAAVTPAERATPIAENVVQPAFFVTRFDWPPQCRQLLALRRDMWNDLIDQLQHGSRENRRVLAIAPAQRGSGATTLSLTLALALAEQGVRAALVDGDWDDPQVSTRLGLAPQVGWDDLDESQLDPSGVLIESTSDGLVLLPCRQPLITALADLPYHAARMVRTLRSNYDLVLVDTGPVESPTVPWHRVWHRSLIDGVILVERANDALEANGVNEPPHGTSADRLLSSAGIAWWGVAETFARSC
ncbi:MAG: AAA family ATPase [Pirellulales bacterium]